LRTATPIQIPYLTAIKGKRVVSNVKKVRVGDVKAVIKLLYFSENYRPGYFGTWTRKSKLVRPRKPLEKDDVAVSYDVDSDEEWGDEDEPGESLSGTEEDASEAESAAGESESEDDWLEEDREAEEMNRRRKVKLEKLVPVTIGVLFQDSPDFSVSAHPALGQFRAESLVAGASLAIDVLTPLPEIPEAERVGSGLPSPTKNSTGSRPVPDEALPKLVTLLSIHHKGFPMKNVVTSFLTEFPTVSKRQVEIKIEELTVKKKLTEFSASAPPFHF